MERKVSSGQPWIHSAEADSFFILFPPFFSVFGALLFHERVDHTRSLPLWAWVVFVVGVDVAHVYGTLFRTYLDPKVRKERLALLAWVPLVCLCTGVVLYSIEGRLFWSVLAYLAVFHFIRQQYGFMRVYSTEQDGKWIDATMIYSASIYPLIYWHTHLPRNFNWFMDGDFLIGLPSYFDFYGRWIYLGVTSLYGLKEIRHFFRTGTTNFPKQMVILGTALSWYVGIVILNGDFAFTLINVVSHGIPYLGLIWILGQSEGKILRFKAWSFKALFLFLGGLFLLAYLEEGFWDGLVWREHIEFFDVFRFLPHIEDHSLLMWLVPLLSVPQFTHYVLDGFIWKRKTFV
jgi:hypothetical protein